MTIAIFIISNMPMDTNLSADDTKVMAMSGPDLFIACINKSTLSTDNQKLVIAGILSAEIGNQGDSPTLSDFDIAFFEDTNGNYMYEISDNILGITTFSGSLLPGASTTIFTNISGSILFRDNLIFAVADSENVITESDDTNNLKNTGEDCEYRPPAGAFNPLLEWSWTTSSMFPDWNQVMCAPAVADLNLDEIPDIVFNTFTGPGHYEWNGILRAISGDGSMELFSITDYNYRSAGGFNVGIADIDNDNLPEIINLRHRYSGDEYRLMAFENDGTHKWFSDVALQVSYISGATIADIDENGIPEIIIGNYVFNNDGTLRWQGASGYGLGISTVANLDMMDSPEIVAGNTAYHSDGTVYWENVNIPESRPGVGNLDNDQFPEVVAVGNGYISVLEHDGVLKWGPCDVPPAGTYHDSVGPPTIADFDDDGDAEIGVAGGSKYVVYENDGTVKWSKDTLDWSSSVTGSSVFDFEGDGSAEVVYADEEFLRIYDGINGDVLWEYRLGSGTLLELPVIVDVDNDNNAEIVMVCNDYVPWSSNTGVYVFGDGNDNWVNTRKIWNQHAYHITNVNDDATIPQKEHNNWEVYNNFRCQALANGTFAAPDLSTCYIRVDDTDFPASTHVESRIGNGGAVGVSAGVQIAFYNGNPYTGGSLLGTVPTSVALAPGQYEDIALSWVGPVGGYHDFYVVADDDGTGTGMVGECCELNNIWHYATIIGQIPPMADAGPDGKVVEGDMVQFDGSGSIDPDGDIIKYEWDFNSFVDSDDDGNFTNDVDARGLNTSFIYGDDGHGIDGIYTVTLTVTDNDNLTGRDVCVITVMNVNPSANLESVYMELEIGLRVAGRKYNDVGMTLYEDRIPLTFISIERLPGSPDAQMAWIPITLNLTRTYSATVTYFPEDPPNIGSNPVWIYLKTENGSIEKIHHNFNIQQSKKRNSEHWNHVEPWYVNITSNITGLPFQIKSQITDPGSDDEMLLYDYWAQNIMVNYHNNPPKLDPYPSPEVNPRYIIDITCIIYKGPGIISLFVEDDDGGIDTQIIAIN